MPQSFPTVRDRTRHRAPGWRNFSPIAVGRTSAICKAALKRGEGLAIRWSRNEDVAGPILLSADAATDDSVSAKNFVSVRR
jgi:hypothetical protein